MGMGTPLRRLINGCAHAALLALALLAAPVVVAAIPAPVDAVPATVAAPVATPPSVTLARLDADPVPARIIAGDFNADFITRPGAVIDEGDVQPRWWRVTVDRAVAASDQPQLVLRDPHLTAIEVWPPGQPLPIRRSLTGPEADRSHSTRALVVPLEQGLMGGDALLVRVHSPMAASMPVSIEPLQQVHRSDLIHVAWRAATLASLLLLGLLAAGLWLGIGERSYAYLSLALLALVAFFATYGGEVRLLPGLAAGIRDDPRVPVLLGLLAAICSLVFLARYLDLRARQPRLLRLLVGCGAALAVLLLVALVTVAPWLVPLATIVCAAAAAVVLVASINGSLERQRSAYFMLAAWLPLVGWLAFAALAATGAWTAPDGWQNTLPAALVVSVLVVMVGLGDSLKQLRRDRDRVSRMATFDALTGALSRSAIEERLATCVAEAHRSGQALSLVFFDVDRFKRINDEYGHQVGDGCLRIIALRTRNRLRTYDMIGRWGGDEMIVVLPDTRIGEALGVAENLRSAVNCRQLSIDGQLFDASLSLGVTELAAGESAEHLLQRADAALYASKSAGRDRVTGHDPRVTGSHTRFAVK